MSIHIEGAKDVFIADAHFENCGSSFTILDSDNVVLCGGTFVDVAQPAIVKRTTRFQASDFLELRLSPTARAVRIYSRSRS